MTETLKPPGSSANGPVGATTGAAPNRALRPAPLGPARPDGRAFAELLAARLAGRGPFGDRLELPGLPGLGEPTGGSHAAQEAAWGAPTPADLEPLIVAAAGRAGLDPALVAAVVQAESGFNPRAVSRAGAKGLMQLMDATARRLGVTDPFDPVQNLNAGATFLRQLLDRYQGDLTLALAAYNAGPGAVDRYRGVPPYAETRSYVAKVLGLYQRAGARRPPRGLPAAQEAARDAPPP